MKNHFRRSAAREPLRRVRLPLPYSGYTKDASTTRGDGVRVLVVGWASFLHGEATAGDVAAMERVATALHAAGVPCDCAWSPGFEPGAMSLSEAEPRDYTDVVFTCGPAQGWQLRELHQRYARCRRIAVGVSVVDPGDPAVTGFDVVLARDGPGTPVQDLASHRPCRPLPVAGVALAPGQPEYGDRRRHDELHRVLREWINALDCAPLELDTRLDTGDWRHCSTPEQFAVLVGRTDVVLTSRLHGLVFALSSGVPALAVDPVDGGGKVSAQAEAWNWPAVVGVDEVLQSRRPWEVLDDWWSWCTSPIAQALARMRARTDVDTSRGLTERMLAELRGCAVAGSGADDRQG